MDFTALPKHPAGIGFHDAGDNLHERGLTGAIFAEQEMDLARLNGEIAVPQSRDATVPFLDVVEFEEHWKRTSLHGFGS